MSRHPVVPSGVRSRSTHCPFGPIHRLVLIALMLVGSLGPSPVPVVAAPPNPYVDAAATLYADAATEAPAASVQGAALNEARWLWGQPNYFSNVPNNDGEDNQGVASPTNLYNPRDIAVDRSGNVYISDHENNRVLFYQKGSNVATREYWVDAPGGIAVDNTGLYVTLTRAHRVLFFPGTSTTPSREYGADGPQDVAVDSTGVYIANHGSHCVLFYPGTSTTSTREYGRCGWVRSGDDPSNQTLSYPFVAVGKGGVYISDWSLSRVFFYPGTSTTGILLYYQWDFNTWTSGLAVDVAGGLYVAEMGACRVIYFAPGERRPSYVYGQPNLGSMTCLSTANKDNLGRAWGVAVDTSGYVYVADTGNHRALLFPPAPPSPLQIDYLSTRSDPGSPMNAELKAKLTYAANGINLIFGNFTDEQVDLEMPSPGLPVRIKRSYNSAQPKNGPLGWGWQLGYDLRISTPSPDLVLLTRGGGRVDPYTVKDDLLLRPPTSQDELERNADGRYVLRTRDHIVYRFTSNGRLSSAADADGNTTTMLYTGDQWTGIRDAVGRTWSMVYDPSGRITMVTDPTGRWVGYTYNSAGDLIAVRNPIGGVTRYEYDANHRITRIINANGKQVTKHVYNADGKVALQDDARGIHTIVYNVGATTYTDPVGVSSLLRYDRFFRPLSRMDGIHPNRGQRATTTLAYNGAGFISSMTDANGGVTSYVYSTRGNPTKITDPLKRVTERTYDFRDNIVSERDARGYSTTAAYNAGNHPDWIKDASGKYTLMTYTDQGLLATVTDPLGRVTSYGYDDFGRQSVITDTLGGVTRFLNDPAGRVISETDALGRTTLSRFDPLNRLLERTAPDGSQMRYTYDAVGNQTRIIDPLGNTTIIAYTAASDPLTITNAIGQPTSFTYDRRGRELSRKEADGKTWRTTYNALGHPEYVISPLGHAITNTYDTLGNLLTRKDAAGHTTTYTYDDANQLLKVRDPLGGEASYEYDFNGNLTVITDTLRHVTTFTYNALNQKTEERNALGYVRTWKYDPVGQVESEQNAADQITTYAYDPKGRWKTETTGKTATAAGITVRWEYDIKGNRTKMTDTHGETTYGYDVMNRLTTVSTPRGAVQYIYDRAGNRVEMRQPGAVTQYTYDRLHRVASVKRGTTTLATYTYDRGGRVSRIGYGNAAATTFSYDGDGRQTALVTRNSAGTTLQSVRYTLDARGNRLTENSTAFGAIYEYDPLSRLTGARVTSGTSTRVYGYAYDAMGNRRSETLNGVKVDYAYDAADRLIKAGSRTVVYDRAGRLTDDGLNRYTYDTAGRLLTISGRTSAAYAYDGDGNRIRETVNGTATTLLLDTALPLPQRIAATNSSGTQRFTYATDAQRVAWFSAAGTPRYEHADGLGSVRMLSTTSGGVSGQSTYAPFGAPLSGGNTFGFTGEPQNATAGLVHLRARDYSTSLGRFLQPDPAAPLLGEPQTLNRYSYVRNNPVNSTDPSGMCEWWNVGCHALSAGSAAVGGVVALGSAVGTVAVSGAQAFHAAAVGTVQAVGAVAESTVQTVAAAAASANQYVTSSFSSANSTSAGIIGTNQGALIGNGSSTLVRNGGPGIIGTNQGALVGNNGSKISGNGVIALGGGNVIALGGGNVIALGGDN